MSELAIYITVWLSCAGFLITIAPALYTASSEGYSKGLAVLAALLWPVTWIIALLILRGKK